MIENPNNIGVGTEIDIASAKRTCGEIAVLNEAIGTQNVRGKLIPQIVDGDIRTRALDGLQQAQHDTHTRRTELAADPLYDTIGPELERLNNQNDSLRKIKQGITEHLTRLRAQLDGDVKVAQAVLDDDAPEVKELADRRYAETAAAFNAQHPNLDERLQTTAERFEAMNLLYKHAAVSWLLPGFLSVTESEATATPRSRAVPNAVAPTFTHSEKQPTTGLLSHALLPRMTFTEPEITQNHTFSGEMGDNEVIAGSDSDPSDDIILVNPTTGEAIKADSITHWICLALTRRPLRAYSHAELVTDLSNTDLIADLMNNSPSELKTSEAYARYRLDISLAPSQGSFQHVLNVLENASDVNGRPISLAFQRGIRRSDNKRMFRVVEETDTSAVWTTLNPTTSNPIQP